MFFGASGSIAGGTRCARPSIPPPRDERVEAPGHAPADGCRRHVSHALALQPVRSLAELVDRPTRKDARVILEVLRGNGDGLEHRRGAPRALTGRRTLPRA